MYDVRACAAILVIFKTLGLVLLKMAASKVIVLAPIGFHDMKRKIHSRNDSVGLSY